MMKLLVFMLTWGCLSASAMSMAQSQRVSLDLREATVMELFEEIQKQTSLYFFYDQQHFKGQGNLSVKAEDETVEEVLQRVFADRGVEFLFEDNTVIVRSMQQQPEQLEVKGVVKDAKGNALPGVTIIIKGTSLGTATDIDGAFRLYVPDLQQTLLFSFVGMEAQEVALKGRRELAVVLAESSSEMEEVVVTGYSTRKVSEMTGAVQQFKGKDIAASATGGNLMNALKGHTTGLQISGSAGAPGQDGELLLRGVGTLFSESGVNTASSTPLIVIDGVVTDYTSINGIVSPADIADITVLKDAASTAIYGSRAATGVIVVTTKRGGKDKMTVSLDVKMGLNLPSFGGLEYMTSQELLEYGEMSLRNWYDNNTALQAQYPGREQFVQDTLRSLRNGFDLSKSTDWRDLSYRTGVTKDVALSFRGGSDKAQYYFSYNYFDEQGTRIGYDLTRHLFKVRMDFDVTDFLSFGVNMNGSFEKNVTPNTLGVQGYHPWLSPYNEDGSLKYSIPWWSNFVMNSEDKVNSLQDDRYNNIIDLQNNLFGSFSGTLKPFKWMTISSTNTFTLMNSNQNDYQDSRTYSGNHQRNNNLSNGTLRVADARNWSFLTSNLLRMQHTFGRHALSGLVGQEWYERHSRSSEVRMYDQSLAGERNIGGFTKQGEKGDDGSIPAGNEAESGSFSVFSEVNYNYDSRYMASVSFRTDGSTNFGKDNRYGTFYSVSASWLLSRERFMQRQSLFSNLKMRLSYGTSGKEAGMDYLNYTLYTIGNTTFDYYWNHPAYQSAYAAELNQLGNDQLSWETAHNLNFGLDMGVLANRIALFVDVYKRRNSDLIMPVVLPAAYGVGKQYQNIGEMENKGVELVLNTHNIKGNAFNWYMNFTFSYNSNKLTKLYQGELSRDDSPTLYEGDNIDVLKLVEFVGIDPQTGRVQFEKVNDDGSVEIVNRFYEATAGTGENSYVDCGLSRAPYFGGFTNTFTYKNWELYVHTVYSFGNKVHSSLKETFSNGRTWLSNNVYKQPSEWKRWEKPGDDADLPMLNADPSYSPDFKNKTSFTYQSGNYWKISNVRLSYNFPQRWLNTLRLQNAALSLTCDNLHTFKAKDFVGADPENPNGWAAPKRFVFGLNVTF